RPNWEEALDDFADDVHVIGDNFKEDFQREFNRTRDAARQSTPFGQRQSGSYQRSYTGKTSQQNQKSQKKPAKIKDGKLMTALGAVLGVGGLAAFLNALAFWLPNYPLYALRDADVITSFFFAGVGAGLLVWGQFKHRKARRFRKLLNLIGDHQQIDIRTLAEAMPCSYNRACDLVQDMVDDGLLGPKAYIDMSTGYLVLDGKGVTPKPKPQPQTPEEERSSDESVLAQIRKINQAIPDPVLSRKIDRIEEITGHILDYQKRHPEKAGELHRFLNYYLPTTLKILNAYAELDSQGVEGANITATKERIENMMDLVVEGFEKQLDKLFEGDMMDISSDISVMEKMLSRDGLAGGMKMPKAEEAEKTADPGIRLTLDPEGTVSQTKADAAAQKEPAASSDLDAAQPFPQSFSQYAETPVPARQDTTTEASWADGFYRRTKDDLHSE
ncbi:MAG: 5-bromo-4-chloroindolyl phosphate hydrolysis family protein, partial [Clostridiales bacterium]|nr:5-bromo-4-chloroindolyl phosphate hydrolysis family protein [Clostridiales bacterium]